jgi:hypothetical protein
VRLDHGENLVYRATSRRQLELSHHAGKAANLFDQRLGRLWPKRHAEHDHRRAQRPPEFGDVPNRLLGNGFLLALGLAGLAQGGSVLFPGCTNLLQLGLDFLELLRQELEDTVLLDDLEDGGVLLLLDRRQLHHHPRADHTRPCNQGHQVKPRQEANAEPDKNRGIVRLTLEIL